MSQQPDLAASQYPANEPEATVPLSELKCEPQWVDCPSCKKTAQTRVKGRGEGMQTFMSVMFWPIDGRKHWFETTHWLCGNCETELASQKNGKGIKVLATP